MKLHAEWVVLAVLTGMSIFPGQAWSGEESVRPTSPPATTGKLVGTSAGQDTVTLNFVGADIEGVVKAISDITGKNFLLDPRVKGVVNIVSARPMARSVVYEVFLSALRLQGFSVIESQGVAKIIPESEAKFNSSATFGPADEARGDGDRIQTRIYAMKSESAAQLVPVLRPLITPHNTITAYPNSNTLVITDYAGNLKRIEKIIDAIDQPKLNEPVIVALQHSSAVDVAVTVNRLFAENSTAAAGSATDPLHRFSVVADARSNSLVVRSADQSRLAQLRTLVGLLDTPTRTPGNIHVVYLKNAEAVKLAETLRAIYQGETGTGTLPRAGSAISTSLGAAPSLATSGAPGSGGGQAPGTVPAAGIIQADAATNSIIITAPDAVYNNLRAALDRLDVRRAQVYVEALIAEVTADKSGEFGIQWQDLGGLGRAGTQGFGGTNFGGAGQNIIGLSQNPLSAGRGINVGIIRGQVNAPGVGPVLNLGLLVRALESDTRANILSTPTLLTLDNEEAAIVIGQNVPFITGQYAMSGAATTPSPFQTIERRDVGLTLRIKPQVSEGGTVRLQIFQEVSSVQDTSNTAGVITNKRAVTSTVLVDDGQIVVIGGLIQNSVIDSEQKVPILGDIPYLGALFRYRTRSHSKTNLMIFLRPTVVRDSQRADAFTGERYDYIFGEQRKAMAKHDPTLPDVDVPIMPPRTAPLYPSAIEPKPPGTGAE